MEGTVKLEPDVQIVPSPQEIEIRDLKHALIAKTAECKVLERKLERQTRLHDQQDAYITKLEEDHRLHTEERLALLRSLAKLNIKRDGKSGSRSHVHSKESLSSPGPAGRPAHSGRPARPAHYGRPIKAEMGARQGRASPTDRDPLAQGRARGCPRAMPPPLRREPTPVRSGPRVKTRRPG